ncbi:MAG: phosphoribosylglycinamide formyltransferase [Betaproteobacteria bacterium]|nr:phosphoribosylglycinamide formyltransferase [Betaproteobacteria bacterium]
MSSGNPKTMVILISGRGSNMEALLKSRLPGKIAAVISNRPDAKGLQTARGQGVETAVIDHRAHPTREAFDAALAQAVDRYSPDLVVLAGFMRILTDRFVARYSGRLLNIHPSLLPAFPGLDTHARAIESGVTIHGCTVHFVTPSLDHGPIVIQAAVPVLPGDTEDALAARVLSHEHRIYPQAVRWFLEDRLRIAGERVRVKGARAGVGVLYAPEPDQ